MPSTLVPVSLGIVAACSAGVAVYFFRRASSLYALLVEGANRFEEIRQRNSQLEQAIGKAEERMRLQRETAQRLERSVDDARDKGAELVKRLEAKEHEARLTNEKLELQKGHLERQLLKADERANAAEAGRAAAEAAVEAAGQAAEDQRRRSTDAQRLALEAQRQDLLLRERELALKLRDLEKDYEKAQRKVRDADPMEMRRLKRRIAQYDRLYTGMKGLREMTEERNRNYEVALEKLSEWVVRKVRISPVPTQLGPLVGTALQAIGAQLIEDSEVRATVVGQAAATSGRVHEIPDARGRDARPHADDDHGTRGLDLRRLTRATLDGSETGELDLDAEEEALAASERAARIDPPSPAEPGELADAEAPSATLGS